MADCSVPARITDAEADAIQERLTDVYTALNVAYDNLVSGDPHTDLCGVVGMARREVEWACEQLGPRAPAQVRP